MRKQHFTTQVASLVNPPISSKYERLQQEMLEIIYASKKADLGRAPSPTVPLKAIKQGFGIITDKGDSANKLLYPYNCRIFHSIYNDSFKPPNQINFSEVPQAGLKIKEKNESGDIMKKVFDIGSVKSTTIVPLTTLQKKDIKNNTISNKETCCDVVDTENNCQCLALSNQVKTCLCSENLLLVLWNLVKNKKSCFREHFYSYIKSYLQNFSKIFTVKDLQKMLENFDVSVSKNTLKQVLSGFEVLDNNEDINYDKFLKALKWESVVNEISKPQSIKLTFTY